MRLIFRLVIALFFVGWSLFESSVNAQDNEATGKALLKKLEEHLAKKYPDRESDRAMTDLVGELAKLKYAPAKRAVYETVFYWFGFDDTMIEHSRLFSLKDKMEKEFAKRALEAAAGLDDVKTTSMVFLTNRRDLATNPATEPKQDVLIHIETTSQLDFKDAEQKRGQIGRKLNIPTDCVGLSWGISKSGRIVSHVDPRLDTQPGYFLLWRVSEFLKNDHDADDDRFLRWSVENRKIKRGLASEYFPPLFPPAKRPDLSMLSWDTHVLAVKIFAHYGLAKLEKFTVKAPGAFKDLLESGALSKEDMAKVAHYKFQTFTFRKNVVFSRRYELSFHYLIDEDNHTTSIGMNHLGEVANGNVETDTSSDLPADVKLMWSIDKKGRSPQEAIEAASRVFNTVKLEGKHRDEIVKLIGDPSHRPKGVYNGPFWPSGKNDLVCRFDTGFYGWQFNLRFDEKGICKTVTRKWIH